MKSNHNSVNDFALLFLVAIMTLGFASNAIAQQNTTNGQMNATTAIKNMTGIANNSTGGVPDPILGSGATGSEGKGIGAMGNEETPSGNNGGNDDGGGNTGGIGGGLNSGSASSDASAGRP
jgi:hypothetical protein